jgi:hypothetical protein
MTYNDLKLILGTISHALKLKHIYKYRLSDLERIKEHFVMLQIRITIFN